MILTVTLNVSLDKYYRVPDFSPGDVNRVEKMIPTAGGKGLNVARVACALGAPVKATGIIGGLTGDLICNLLSDEGIEFEFLKAPIESRTCINIIESEGRSTELLESGDAIGEETVSAFFDHFTRLLDEADVVALSGSALRGMPNDIYGQLTTIAWESGIPTILDTSGERLLRGIEAAPAVIKPNQKEIGQLMGKEEALADDLIDHCMAYVGAGVQCVVVSLGSEGALLITKEGVWQGRPPKLEVVNTVGSGDSMVAAFAVSLRNGDEPEVMLRRAIAVSAANTLTESTGHIRPEDVETIREQVRITRLR
ncbi:1-phosphofructokinase [Kroppenstedtia eburnea]|uniref:Tagatose-6-phosphate kinase n=1 Tax=Kroppenstedtia eburnea TaxID=714067 RepID=A0A1N7MG20_9BACL|nr:1-phosphofructokinase [Kroppenstedtia eburnea]EGK07066.1 tagatose-6-phosphate kinase [Desmospora sp. 8437]QKI81548.1 1-phosphofructokinase [Kroppenstedtia eburnea]SIS84982.1 tagatose 6-phosphate kinase [Kroppenstedtia eburnea]